jgi:hypothetical protein
MTDKATGTRKISSELEVVGTLAAAAQLAGIEFSAQESVAWVNAAEAEAADPGEFDVRPGDGIGGFDIALLDFDPASAARLRAIGDVIETRRRPNVRSGLAIAGSAAQGRIQPFPADNDFFERWHIVAPTIDDARAILAKNLREDVVALIDHPGLVLDDVSFGSVHGRPLRWNNATLQAGSIQIEEDDGTSLTINWLDAAADPGFTKIAWVLIDPSLGGPGMASKVIDATWQDPKGTIISLDGLIDGEFQQIYLDAMSAELAAEVTRSVSESSRVRYITDLESQVANYSRGDHPNFAKVAKRLYNICRITRRYDEALFLRELFDEPPARLIQIESRLWVAHRKAEFDFVGAVADVRSAISDCGEFVSIEKVSFQFEATDSISPEHFATSITTITASISAIVTTEFERRLRAYGPILALLDDIARRYPPAS